jgi:hypothetical protein
MSATTTIEQKPLFAVLPVGQEIIFAVSNNTITGTQTKVKFVAEIHISPAQINLASTSKRVGTFKTTPNAEGVGMFDLRNVVENYVKADHEAVTLSSYKTTTFGVGTTDPLPPIHVINKFSRQRNSLRHMAIKFSVEYLDQDSSSSTYNQIITAVGSEVSSDDYQIFNGYLKYTDELTLSNNEFGFDITTFFAAATGSLSTSSRRYLTNAPTTQYANSGDYGTLAMLFTNQTTWNEVKKIVITYYDHSGSAYAGVDSVSKNQAGGTWTGWSSSSYRNILYFGCFPGNLENWSTNYATAVAGGLSHYIISADDNSGGIGSNSLEPRTIYVNCPTLKGYEPIRLCWLNQWGAWDYYTFTMKSKRNISTQGSTYHQLGGTWNESRYRLDTYKGGKKSFRVNATEKITMNTDFVSESDNVMFEELINSPEVYLLQGFQTDITGAALNQYVTPVRLTTSSFAKKTVANDKLIQYTFEIEKSKTLRTQSI